MCTTAFFPIIELLNFRTMKAGDEDLSETVMAESKDELDSDEKDRDELDKVIYFT